MLIKKYPYLSERFGNSEVFALAHLYEIDLSEAEEKVKYCEINGGTEENDIWIDVAFSISDWLNGRGALTTEQEQKSLIGFVLENMDNWGYTQMEEWETLKPQIIKKLHKGEGLN